LRIEHEAEEAAKHAEEERLESARIEHERIELEAHFAAKHAEQERLAAE